jgi:hypothetical protein
MWDYNLDRMNENKKGKPYSFPDSFILIMDYIRIYFHLPYRQTEGVKATEKNLPVYPSYSQICCRRINKLDITSNRVMMMMMMKTLSLHRQYKHKGNKQRPVDVREVEHKKERLSKDTHWSKYKDQRNPGFKSYRREGTLWKSYAKIN